MKLGLLGIALLVPVSCVLLQPLRTQDLYIDPRHEADLAAARFNLEEVVVKARSGAAEIRTNAQYIYGLILAKHNSQSQGIDLRIRTTLREEPFVRGFETRNTVSIETRVYRPGDSTPFAFSLYSEETVDTITSYSYLYRVVQASVKPLLK